MSTTEVQESPTNESAKGQPVDMKLEVVVIPVSDIGRSTEFYAGLGWRVDANLDKDGVKLVQLTPRGSGCSVQFGTNATSATPGSAQSLYLVVSDLEAARQNLLDRGVPVSEAFHEGVIGGRFYQRPASGDRLEGRSPDGGSYKSFATFSDPDGNLWLLQEITKRLPDRVGPEARYLSVNDLAQALRRASAAHGEHEKRIGHADANWPDWYAAYMLAEANGADLPV
jgi:catechol 2,3-dioxygenase-like lactoylglutathione lyase family enzyme